MGVSGPDRPLGTSAGRDGRDLARRSASLEYAIFLALHLGLDVNYLVATGASVCISALGKFGFYREVVFRRGRAAPAAEATAATAVTGADEARRA